MAIVIEGLTLPDIPEGLLDDTFKYAAIVKKSSADSTLYSLSAIASPMVYIPLELSPFGVELLMFSDTSNLNVRIAQLTDSNGVWSDVYQEESIAAGVVGKDDGSTSTVVWANHDIKVGAPDDSGENVVATDEIYFAKNDTPAEPEEPVKPEPEYGKIKRQHMRDIGDAIRRKTGKTDKMPPEQMAEAIDGVSVEYPNAANAYLGYEGDTGEFPTGYMLAKQSTNTYRFKKWPETYSYQWAYWHTQGSTLNFYLVQSELPAWFQNRSNKYLYCDANCNYVVYKYDVTTETWNVYREGVAGSSSSLFALPSMYNWFWTNYDILCKNDSAYSQLMSSNPEIVPETTTENVEIANTYAANGVEMNSVVLSVKKITGNNSPMTFSQAVQLLEDYAASLE